MDAHRVERVSEALREELSEIIGYEMSDPRLRSVDVTEVVVTPDSRHARVLVHAGGTGEERESALVALEGARHYLRRELASRLRLFRIPELHFEQDAGLDAGSRVELLLKRVRKGRPRPAEPDEKKPLE